MDKVVCATGGRSSDSCSGLVVSESFGESYIEIRISESRKKP